MTAVTAPRTGAGRLPGTAAALVAAALTAAALVAVLLNAGIAAGAIGLGADSRFGPLQTTTFMLWTVGGTAIATAGWAAIRRWATDPRAVLRWAVPAALLVSLVPDVLLLVTPLEAHTDLTGVLALMLMHAVVAALAVPVLSRVLPLPHVATRSRP